MKYQQEKGIVFLEGSRNNQEYDGRGGGGGGNDSLLQRCPHCSSFDIKLRWSPYSNFFQPMHICRTWGRFWAIGGKHTNVCCPKYFNLFQHRHICKTWGRSWAIVGGRGTKLCCLEYFNFSQPRHICKTRGSSSSSTVGAGTAPVAGGSSSFAGAGGTGSFAGAGGTGPSAVDGPSDHPKLMITTTTTDNYNKMEFKIPL